MKHVVIYILIAIFVVSCGNSVEEQERMTRAERQRLLHEDSLALKFAVLPTADCMPLFLAKEKRMFDTLGVDVRLRCFTSQMDCDTAFVGSSVEGIVTDLVRAKRMREQGVAIDYLSTTNAYWQLLANRKARLKRINQFGDKMIGMTRYSATDYLCDCVLGSARIHSIAFRIQVNDVNIRLRMLLNNEMDAVWLAEPFATTARLAGHNVVMDSRDINKRLGVIALRANRVMDERRKKQIVAFVKAYNAACDSINVNGMGHYSDVLRKYYKVDDRTISALPKLKFNHIEKPRSQDIDLISTSK